jgi:hypothetical protein
LTVIVTREKTLDYCAINFELEIVQHQH